MAIIPSNDILTRPDKTTYNYGTINWFLPYEMAHTAKEESLGFTTVENKNELGLLMQDCHRDFVEIGGYPMFPNPEIYGPKWGNYPEKERKIKQLLNPNNLAPTETAIF